MPLQEKALHVAAEGSCQPLMLLNGQRPGPSSSGLFIRFLQPIRAVTMLICAEDGWVGD
jgi:hypothetical protein